MYRENNEIYPGGAIYESMGVWSIPKHKKDQLQSLTESGKYFAQVKKDGNWYAFNKGKNGELYLYSRNPSTVTGYPTDKAENVPHLLETLKSLPNDSVLTGEVYYPDQPVNVVRSVMGAGKARALAFQKDNSPISYYLYDILRYNGKDLTQLPSEERYVILRDIIEKHNLLANPFIQVAEIATTDIFNFINDALRNNEEGVVLKLKTGKYIEGKKPAWNMIKIKKEDDVDVVCIGFLDPTREYTGTELDTWEYWSDKDFKKTYRLSEIKQNKTDFIPVTKPYFYKWKNAIEIGAYKEQKLISIGSVSSGISDELKEGFAKNPDKYINRTIRCACMEITDSALRHPIFIDFRDDKNPKECTWKSVFGEKKS